MPPRGTRGAYRKEEREELPKDLQKELVERASARFGTLEKLAKKLEMPKSSVHYYRTGRLTLPISVMERLLRLAGDPELEERVREAAVTKNRTWANAYAAGIHRAMCKERVNLPTKERLEHDPELRRKAAAIVSYVMAEGSIWIKHNRFDAPVVNITFADHESDLYDHFRSLCRDVFDYDIGPPQAPGNNAKAIRGFLYSRFIADWLIDSGVPVGEKSATDMCFPPWVMDSQDSLTWGSAIQPWIDGEGGVIWSGRGSFAGIAVGQSRHTDLDFDSPPVGFLRTKDQGLGRSVLSSLDHCHTDMLRYVESVWRSRILCCVRCLSRRLDTDPVLYVSRLRFRESGFWSAIWMLRYGKADSIRLLELGAVLQRRKRTAIEASIK